MLNNAAAVAVVGFKSHDTYVMCVHSLYYDDYCILFQTLYSCAHLGRQIVSFCRHLAFN